MNMDIQQLINFDQELLLKMNGSNSLFWDGFMWVATSTYIWIPVGVILLYVIFKNNKIKEAFLIVGLLAIVVALADQISSGFCKPFFARFRPTQDPVLMFFTDVVNGYRGGRYGFISSHAANTFAVAVFVSLIVKNASLGKTLFLWAALNAYSRIYLGVHYPGDILFGTLVGISVGIIIYLLYRYLHRIFFKQSRYISNQYTSSGYLISDVHLLNTIMYLTIFVIIAWGMLITYIYHF